MLARLLIRNWFWVPCVALVVVGVTSMSLAMASTQITRATLELLQEEGHALQDILAAETLVAYFDADLSEILQQRQSGAPWFAIIQSIEDQERTKGYTRADAHEVAAALGKGYGVNDLVAGNLMAQRFQYDLQVMMILKQDESKWLDVFDTLYAEEHRIVEKTLVGQPMNITMERAGIDEQVQLAERELHHHLARGLDADDFKRAVEIERNYNVGLELVTAVKSRNLGWADVERLLNYLIDQE